MYMRRAITLQVDSCHNLDPRSYDLHKLSDTQSILMYHSVVKVLKNYGAEFFKIKLQSLIYNIVC